MSFSDLRFIFYFLPVFVLLHTVAPSRARNALLFLGSLGLYAFGAGSESAGVLLALTALNYLFARWMTDDDDVIRRAFLCLGLFFDFGALFFFKYLTALVALFTPRGATVTLHVILPLGVSFYIFQMAAYLIDVYRRKIEPEANFFETILVPSSSMM